MVMAFHFSQLHPGPALVQRLGVIGQTGVDLFFVLSGFLITRILLASKESPTFFRTFYARRVFRIFPLYYGYLAFHYFVLPWIFNNSGNFALPWIFNNPVAGWEKQWWFWLYLQNIPATFPGFTWSGPGHFWSLAVEEHFYLFWPVAVWALSRQGFKRLTIGVLLFTPLLRAVFLAEGLQVYYFTFTRMDALAFGALLALVSTSQRVGDWLPWLRGLAIALPVLMLGFFAVLSGSQAMWLQVVKLSLIPATYAAVMGVIVLDPKLVRFDTLLALPPLRWVGKISYGLYVYHPFAFILSHEHLRMSGSYAGDLFLGFGLAFLFAAVSYRFFEEPILRLKRHFAYA